MVEDVLWLDVPMDNITIVHKFNCVANLLHDVSHLLLWKSAITPKTIINVSTAADLHDEVEILLVREKGVKLDYIRMIHVALNFDLTNELIYVFLFAFKNAFWDLL
jgi:hypothetical protein